MRSNTALHHDSSVLDFISLGMLKRALLSGSREHIYCPLLHSSPLIVMVLCWISLLLGLPLHRRQLPPLLLNSASKSATEIMWLIWVIKHNSPNATQISRRRFYKPMITLHSPSVSETSSSLKQKPDWSRFFAWPSTAVPMYLDRICSLGECLCSNNY